MRSVRCLGYTCLRRTSQRTCCQPYQMSSKNEYFNLIPYGSITVNSPSVNHSAPHLFCFINDSEFEIQNPQVNLIPSVQYTYSSIACCYIPISFLKSRWYIGNFPCFMNFVFMPTQIQKM